MSDAGLAMEVEAGPSAIHREMTPTPRTFNLAKACHDLLQDLGVFTIDTKSTLSIPQPIRNAAFDNKDASPTAAEVLVCLSQLALIRGMITPILEHFGPITLDTSARWLDDANQLSNDDWEDRLSVVAQLAALRPDLWR